MNKYLIFSDLDDTLLTTDKRITEKSISYIKKLISEGHIFCISTGRPLQGCINYAKQLGFSSPIITENGSNIYFPDENMKIKSFLIDKDVFKNLLFEIKDIIISAFTGTKNYLYVQNREKVPFWIIHEDDNHKLIEGVIYDNICEDPHLPSIIVSDEKIMNEVLKKYPAISYRAWGKNDDGYTYELFSSNASKGNALLYLKEYYNIKDGNTMAFGDQLNDSSMILCANYGCAMINGKDELKKISNLITKYDNNNNGVIEAIKEIIEK